MKISALIMVLSLVVAQNATAEEKLQVAPVMKKMTVQEQAPPADMFEDADGDGDGVLSKQEFLGRAEAHFKEMDMDADGLVTADEMHALSDKKRLQMRQYMQKQKSAQKTPKE